MKKEIYRRLACLVAILCLVLCLGACDGDELIDQAMQLVQPQESETQDLQPETEKQDDGSQKEHKHSGGEATCSAKAVCDVCGEEYGELVQHPAAEDYSTDETHHWYGVTCSHTGEKIGYEEHSFNASVTPPTCSEQGYTMYTCECGYSYEDDHTPASGHTYDTAYTFNDGQHWHKADCEHTSEISGLANHTYTQSVTPPTCTEQGYTTHTCVCGYFYKSDYTDASGHSVSQWEQTATELTDPTKCKYSITYGGTCGACGKPQTKTEYIEKHSFYWSVSEVACCQDDGVKVKLCASEQCVYHSTPKEQTGYSDPDNHLWGDGNTVGAVTTYTCVCGESKRTVEVTGDTADLTADDVAAADEVKISDIVIGFDSGVKQTLSENDTVSIGASALEGADKQQAVEALGLSKQQIEQIGDSTVYDFTLNNGTVSQLGGTATVKVPYTLASGENPENIIVWYISNGEITSIPATYENGYAIFQTDHFSYYTVTKISPIDRCKYYGHSQTEISVVEPTCTKEGYTLCLRCGQIIATSAPTGHNWDFEIIRESSCELTGIKRYSCSGCTQSYDEAMAATGHKHSSEWTVTDSAHSHKCEDCEHVADLGNHVWDYEEATEEHGVSCTVCGFVREEKKPPAVEPTSQNTVTVDVASVGEGRTKVSVKLLKPYMAGIRLRISYGALEIASDTAYEASVYHDAGGYVNYVLASERNFVDNDMTLIEFTVTGDDPDVSVEVIEIYVFDGDYNIKVPNYAEGVN